MLVTTGAQRVKDFANNDGDGICPKKMHFFSYSSLE